MTALAYTLFVCSAVTAPIAIYHRNTDRTLALYAAGCCDIAAIAGLFIIAL
jgi:hypothetical protein